MVFMKVCQLKTTQFEISNTAKSLLLFERKSQFELLCNNLSAYIAFETFFYESNDVCDGTRDNAFVCHSVNNYGANFVKLASMQAHNQYRHYN